MLLQSESDSPSCGANPVQANDPVFLSDCPKGMQFSEKASIEPKSLTSASTFYREFCLSRNTSFFTSENISALYFLNKSLQSPDKVPVRDPRNSWTSLITQSYLVFSASWNPNLDKRQQVSAVGSFEIFPNRCINSSVKYNIQIPSAVNQFIIYSAFRAGPRFDVVTFRSGQYKETFVCVANGEQ